MRLYYFEVSEYASFWAFFRIRMERGTNTPFEPEVPHDLAHVYLFEAQVPILESLGHFVVKENAHFDRL